MKLKKEEFLKLIEDCKVSSMTFDQRLLDTAAAMFEKWGLQAHDTWAETDKEHLFTSYGMVEKSDDSDALKGEKKALRCIASKIMKTQINKEDAVGIMKNLNSINKPGFRWLQ
ncbi:MAG: hypothetical protein A4E48_02780 [Methanosaeta sp. PtaU1.Bin060]|jgi:hypothetical protein|nr:MAG: hypothetical protein A4E48_02780 [Methanosaeta sp. PtaU1.Bin060]